MFRLLREKLGLLKKKAAEGMGPDEIFSDGFFDQRMRKGKLDDILWELELSLLEADVALPVIEEIQKKLKEELIGKKVKRDISVEDAVEIALRNAIVSVLSANPIDFDRFIEQTEKPVAIMFVGVN